MVVIVTLDYRLLGIVINEFKVVITATNLKTLKIHHGYYSYPRIQHGYYSYPRIQHGYYSNLRIQLA